MKLNKMELNYIQYLIDKCNLVGEDVDIYEVMNTYATYRKSTEEVREYIYDIVSNALFGSNGSSFDFVVHKIEHGKIDLELEKPVKKRVRKSKKNRIRNCPLNIRVTREEREYVANVSQELNIPYAELILNSIELLVKSKKQEV